MMNPLVENKLPKLEFGHTLERYSGVGRTL
jgi:hypothetical protein